MNRTSLLVGLGIAWAVLVVVLWHFTGCSVETPC